ncbi:hypothetical protein OYC64_000426 [Pagothenia borchgrevinki]|uniref:Uncharacterized protein n=1 Tax=Pagothenia borchgrevinki TaxID=8213 RepID=A0ABD2HCV8_PAGBO
MLRSPTLDQPDWKIPAYSFDSLGYDHPCHAEQLNLASCPPTFPQDPPGGAKNKPLSPFRKRGSLQYAAGTGELGEHGEGGMLVL